MSNPIESSRVSNASYDPSIHYSEEAGVCGDPGVPPRPTVKPQAAGKPSAASQLLVAQHRSRHAPAAAQSTSATAPRAAVRLVPSPATPAPGFDDGVLSAGVAVGKAKVLGGAVEALSVSAQTGAQNQAQLGSARLTFGANTNSLQLRAPEAEAHVGAFNPDGSLGVNAGAGISLLAAETTVGDESNSVTAGVNVGWGGEASAGIRDADQDGQAEYCMRVGLSMQALPVGFVVGACVEPEGLYEGLKALVAGRK